MPKVYKNGQCTAISLKGEQCLNDSMPDSEYCWFHDERYKEAVKAAGDKGGKVTKEMQEAREAGDADLEDLRPVTGAWFRRIHKQVMNGKIPKHLDEKLKVIRTTYLVLKEATTSGGDGEPDSEREGVPDEFGERIARAIARGDTANTDAGEVE